MTELVTQPCIRPVDTQCFTDDALGRLTEAWTAKTDCSSKPSASTVGGPDAYWQTFKYDPVGNRTQQTDHGTGALAGADATTTYAHNNPNTGLPHAVQTAAVTGGPQGGQKSTFKYDAAGNTTKRTIGATTQDLSWDDEGHLATLTEAGKTTSYQYDADGNRLITMDADGTQTLTLPGNNELKIDKDGTKQGTRYCTHEGQTIAVRNSSGFSFLIPDQQGTAMAAVAMTTLAVTRRKQLPFGQIRSEQTETIPGTRGFVGGTPDPTGLTHLGAREYDPTLGQFLSGDPINDIDDPAQMNAYSYAHNNPITGSDPTGLKKVATGTINCYTGNMSASCASEQPDHNSKAGRARSKQLAAAIDAPRYCYGGSQSASCSSNTSKATAHRKSKTNNMMKAQANARAKKKAEAERRKKDGIFGWVKKGVSAAHGFMQEHSTLLGGIGVVLGVAAMITPVGWIVAAGFALAAVTTADACFSKQWGSCAIGAVSFGLAGGGAALAKSADSLSAVPSAGGFGREVLQSAYEGGMRGIGRVSDGASVAFAGIGTLTGGNLGHSRTEDDY
ncbi:RHS repeat domain-containing protein [Streptomyces sp. NBC_01014]|uniref:RHS repeat domain-containing protein n=1 Tax=Streptomyces sp. NBC_01014 TaxID=2903719 RepID=UPI003868F789|nr:RHS repeat-associated core domain-containing protein [Streptomyces sp. NBC_01014]